MLSNAGGNDVPVTSGKSLIDRGHMIAACVVGVALLAVYYPVFAHAVDLWSVDEEMSFGFIMPPIAIGLLWLRRRAILRSITQERGSGFGLLFVALGMVLLVIDIRSSIRAIGGASFAVTFLGAIAYLYGLKTARLALFPIAFLTVGLSLYRGLFQPLGFSLQSLTARYSAQTASLLGVPVRRDGVDLFVGNFHFTVAEACSGMNSLLALLCLGTLVVGLAQNSLPRRALLMLLIVPIVLVANIIRVTLVLTLSRVIGLTVVDSFVHGSFSAIIFLLAFGLFFLVGKVLGCSPRIAAMA